MNTIQNDKAENVISIFPLLITTLTLKELSAMSKKIDITDNQTNQAIKVCSKCKNSFPLNSEFFSKNSRSKDGFDTRCKECVKEYFHSFSEDRKKENIVRIAEYSRLKQRVGDGEKACNKCKRILPATTDFFQRDSRNKDGFKIWCTECRSKEMLNNKNKMCTKCKQYKPRTKDFFYGNIKAIDGLYSICKECASRYSKKKRSSAIKKICRICKEEKLNTIEFFNAKKVTADGLSFVCKSCDEILKKTKVCATCKKEKPRTSEFFYRNRCHDDMLSSSCKECISKRNKSKNRVTKRTEYRRNNAEKISKQCRKYKENHKEETSNRQKQYDNAKFKSSAKKMLKEISIYEEVKIVKGGYVQVKCAYCGKWISPTNRQVKARNFVAKRDIGGENRIYCNDNNDACKLACPTYHQQAYPKGFKKATSREVNPLVRQLCFLRDEYTCQKCGVTIEKAQLHCHHIEGYAQNKMIGNDIKNVITLCKNCHKAVHKIPGCGYNELRNDSFECV